ncbi:hypothetical protein [Herpetosiphon giganteus]|uniref:hypothetical protein n=1 Tax=Herpetosiphon giganteus TaxID=2029754 RepID=UPI001958AAB9|nr:hypothetical protein [Herpetosiphon giganteus]MBM7846646.1 competence CoiA-like predicted nuclease [Herpetosiphon giganteus]
MWLEYGIRKDKKRIHISQVPRGRTGLRCPYCDRYLIAKKGKIIRHHFVMMA